MKPKHSSRSLICIFKMAALPALGALLAVAASAQSGHGTISGRAEDKAGAVLDGARVRLQPGDMVTATDGQGEFNFIGLAPGNYTLTISYVGFTDFTKQVTVAAGQANHIEAKMDVSAKSEEVTVVADRPHGEAEAINRQRTSDNILQVLPSDVITALPNANIADAVGRLPSVTLERDEGEGKYVQIRGTEPRLNNVTIDGITIPAPEGGVRQVKLDTIPADIVESVEVNKTLSANQDAEAIGGTVNLVTKTAGDLPTLTLGVIGGFTPILNTRAIAQVSGTVGQRFGATKKFGALFSGSFDYNGRGIDDIEPSPDTGQLSPPLYDSIDLREYRYKRKRYGFGGSLDYKLGDGAGLYLHYFYSDFRDYGDKWVYTLNDGTGCTGDATTAVPCPPPQFSGSERAPDYRIGSVAIGGKHIFTNSWLAWNISASASLQTAAAGNPGFDFQYNGPVTANGQSVGPPLCTNVLAPNPNLPQWSPACTAPGSPVYDPTQWSLLDIDTTSGNTSQVNLAGAISYAQNYHLGKHNATFEFGFKVRNDRKGQNAYSPVYDNATPAAPLMTQYLSGFTNPNYYFNDYRLGPVVSWPSITASLPNLVSQGILSLDSGATHLGSDASNFELTERISSAYVMNTIDSGRFRLQTGFRVEATQLNTLGYIVTNDANGNWLSTKPFPANAWYWDPLPSVQLRYRLDEDSDLRAVYGRGISRPNPYDTIPYVELDESTNPYTVALGNPNLKPEHANSYDLLYERYLKPFGEIQAGFFYKQLSSPIYYTNALAVNTGTYAGENVSQIINGSNARLLGFEVAYIQHLGFLPGVLSGTGISANYSWTTSNSGALPGRTDTPALQRQAPNTWNISPTYDRGRFSTRAGLSYNGASIYQYQWQTGAGVGGTAGPAGDTYFYPHLQVDAQASYRVRKDLTFLAQGLNLTNEVFGFYNGSPQYVLQREFYNRTYSFGLRWEPRREY